MKVLICGLDKIGFSLISPLLSLGFDITVIDKEESNVKKASEQYNVMAHVGFPSDSKVLLAAHVTDVDIVFAVTTSDEVNLMLCLLCAKQFKVKRRIARVKNFNYKDFFGCVCVDALIYPEFEVGCSVTNMLNNYSLIQFSSVTLLLISVRKSMDLVVSALSNLPIACVIRDNVVMHVNNCSELLPLDKMVFTVSSDKVLKEIKTTFNVDSCLFDHVLVIGGGAVGESILQQNASFKNLTVIDNDLGRVNALSQSFSEVSVIHGNALDISILTESGIDEKTACICVSNNDQVNIFSSLLAKQLGCKEVLTLVYNNKNYSSLSYDLGLHKIIDPGEITLDSMLCHIVYCGIHSISDGEFKIVEIALNDAQIIKKVNNIDKNKIILIIRRDTVILRTDELLMQNDTVVLYICKAEFMKNFSIMC